MITLNLPDRSQPFQEEHEPTRPDAGERCQR